MVGSAVISDDGQYRYLLERELDITPKTYSPPVVFALCNPSTADASQDDATVRKCGGFTRKLGRSRFLIINAFAYRSRHPKALLSVDDPTGPDNIKWIQFACRHTDAIVIAGWGNCVPDRLRHLLPIFSGVIRATGRDIKMLGPLTGEGMPRHPLMLSYSTPLEEYLK